MSSNEWKRENTSRITIGIANTCGIVQALQRAIEEQEVTKHSYITQAIREKLIRDGYDPEDYKPSKAE